MKKSKQYDAEFKKQTVQYMLEEKKSLSQISREMDIATSTLSGWLKKYHPNPQELKKDKSTQKDKELKEYQKKVRDLEEEVAILKKAAAIFIKSPR